MLTGLEGESGGVGIHHAALPDGEQIHYAPLLGQLGQGDGVLQGVSLGQFSAVAMEAFAAEQQMYNKSGATFFLDAPAQLQDKTAPVFNASAILVGADIRIGHQFLSRIQGAVISPGGILLHPVRSGLNHLADLLPGGHYPRRQLHKSLSALHPGRVPASQRDAAGKCGMHVDQHLGTVKVNIVGQLAQVVVDGRILQIKAVGVGKIVPGGHLAHLRSERITEDDQGIAPAGGLPVEVDELLRGPLLRSLDLVRGALGLDDPVFQHRAVGQHQRRQQFLIAMAHGFLSLFFIFPSRPAVPVRPNHQGVSCPPKAGNWLRPH